MPYFLRHVHTPARFEAEVTVATRVHTRGAVAAQETGAREGKEGKGNKAKARAFGSPSFRVCTPCLTLLPLSARAVPAHEPLFESSTKSSNTIIMHVKTPTHGQSVRAVPGRIRESKTGHPSVSHFLVRRPGMSNQKYLGRRVHIETKTRGITISSDVSDAKRRLPCQHALRSVPDRSMIASSIQQVYSYVLVLYIHLCKGSVDPRTRLLG